MTPAWLKRLLHATLVGPKSVDDWDYCRASVDDAIAYTWSCPCGVREGGMCPLTMKRD